MQHEKPFFKTFNVTGLVWAGHEYTDKYKQQFKNIMTKAAKKKPNHDGELVKIGTRYFNLRTSTNIKGLTRYAYFYCPDFTIGFEICFESELKDNDSI